MDLFARNPEYFSVLCSDGTYSVWKQGDQSALRIRGRYLHVWSLLNGTVSLNYLVKNGRLPANELILILIRMSEKNLVQIND